MNICLSELRNIQECLDENILVALFYYSLFFNFSSSTPSIYLSVSSIEQRTPIEKDNHVWSSLPGGLNFTQ